jgi:hypothetical protein
MRSIFVPLLTVAFLGSAPASVDPAADEYADFMTEHDALHPKAKEQAPEEVLVRKAFWNDQKRTLYVNAETTEGKGTLLIVEGMPVNDWVTTFQVTKSDNAAFQLPIPEEALVPCRIIVRSAHAYRVARIINAPPRCVEAAQAENMLLASLD